MEHNPGTGIVVSDTSSLCNLALVDYLWILREIYQTVVIPTVVADELAAGEAIAITLAMELRLETQPIDSYF